MKKRKIKIMKYKKESERYDDNKLNKSNKSKNHYIENGIKRDIIICSRYE